eukprot:1248734-Pleurochrysis_carterae.AAC.1
MLASSFASPCATTRPASISTTLAASSCVNCSWCDTSTTVARRVVSINPEMAKSTRWRDTCASTADSGSSSRNSEGLPYSARAIEMRAFCPPDTVTPRSPISVSSPFGRLAKSASSAHAATTRLYHSASNGRESTTFSRRVALSTHAPWGTYPTGPAPRSTAMWPRLARISPSSSCSSELLPLPTSPRTNVSLPRGIRMLMFRSAKTSDASPDPVETTASDGVGFKAALPSTSVLACSCCNSACDGISAALAVLTRMSSVVTGSSWPA